MRIVFLAIVAVASALVVAAATVSPAHAQQNCGGLLQPPCPPPPTPTPTPSPSPSPSPTPSPTPTPAPPGALRNARYGGGNANPMPWPKPFQRASSTAVFGVKVSASATTARVYGTLLASCGIQEVSRLVTVRRDGTFRTTYSVGRGARAARITLEGALAGPSGTITAAARLTRRPNRRIVRCSTGALRMALSTARDVGTTSAAPEKSTIYNGLVRQTARGIARPVAVRVDRTGRRVAMFFAYRVNCSKLAVDFDTFDFTPTVAVRADHTFRTTDRYTARYSNAREHYLVRTQGRFTDRGVTGTVSVTVRGRFNSRARHPGPYRCSTGTVRFSAQR